MVAPDSTRRARAANRAEGHSGQRRHHGQPCTLAQGGPPRPQHRATRLLVCVLSSRSSAGLCATTDTRARSLPASPAKSSGARQSTARNSTCRRQRAKKMRREDFNAGRGEEKGCGQALIEPLRTNKRANRDHDDLDARGVALVGHLLTQRVAEGRGASRGPQRRGCEWQWPRRRPPARP